MHASAQPESAATPSAAVEPSADPGAASSAAFPPALPPALPPAVPHALPPALPHGVQRVVLTGFMGSGKTSVGLRLAQQLGWPFFDLDREIERRDGRSVPAIFAESGEPHFRLLEASTLAELLTRSQIVLALGGGAPEHPPTRLLLEQATGTAIVYLAAPLPTLLARCQQDAVIPGRTERPLLPQAETRFRTRHPIYQRLASHTVETASLDLDRTLAAVLAGLRSGR